MLLGYVEILRASFAWFSAEGADLKADAMCAWCAKQNVKRWQGGCPEDLEDMISETWLNHFSEGFICPFCISIACTLRCTKESWQQHLKMRRALIASIEGRDRTDRRSSPKVFSVEDIGKIIQWLTPVPTLGERHSRTRTLASTT